MNRRDFLKGLAMMYGALLFPVLPEIEQTRKVVALHFPAGVPLVRHATSVHGGKEVLRDWDKLEIARHCLREWYKDWLLRSQLDAHDFDVSFRNQLSDDYENKLTVAMCVSPKKDMEIQVPDDDAFWNPYLEYYEKDMA